MAEVRHHTNVVARLEAEQRLPAVLPGRTIPTGNDPGCSVTAESQMHASSGMNPEPVTRATAETQPPLAVPAHAPQSLPLPACSVMSSPTQVETAGQVIQTPTAPAVEGEVMQHEPAVPTVDPNAVKAALMLDAPDGCRSRMYVGSKVFAIKSQLAGEIILCDNGASIS